MSLLLMGMVSVRFDDQQVDRIDRIAEGLRTRVPGIKISRGDVIRALFERSATSFEKELELTAEDES